MTCRFWLAASKKHAATEANSLTFAVAGVEVGYPRRGASISGGGPASGATGSGTCWDKELKRSGM